MITAEDVARALDHAARLRREADRLAATPDGMWGGLGTGRSGRQPSPKRQAAAQRLWRRQAAAEREAVIAEAQADGLRRAFERQADRVPVGDIDWAGVRAVKTDLGWHRVIRVNKQSVTVPSVVGGSWTDRIDKAKVWEVKPPPAAQPSLDADPA